MKIHLSEASMGVSLEESTSFARSTRILFYPGEAGEVNLQTGNLLDSTILALMSLKVCTVLFSWRDHLKAEEEKKKQLLGS